MHAHARPPAPTKGIADNKCSSIFAVAFFRNYCAREFCCRSIRQENIKYLDVPWSTGFRINIAVISFPRISLAIAWPCFAPNFPLSKLANSLRKCPSFSLSFRIFSLENAIRCRRIFVRQIPRSLKGSFLPFPTFIRLEWQISVDADGTSLTNPSRRNDEKYQPSLWSP